MSLYCTKFPKANILLKNTMDPNMQEAMFSHVISTYIHVPSSVVHDGKYTH